VGEIVAKYKPRADGRYMIKRQVDGKIKYFYGNTPEECEDKARAAHAHNITSNDTLKTWIDYWLENVTRPNIDVETYDNYKTLIDKHITGKSVTIASKRLRDLSTQDIRQWSNKLQESLAPKSVVSILTLLKAALTQASHDGIITKSPAAPVKRPKSGEKKHQFIDTATVRKLLEGAGRHKDMFLLMWTSGVRREELLGLCWPDYERGKITIRRAVKKGRKLVDDLKTKAAYRTIPLPAETIDALNERKKKRKVVSLTTPDLIFPDGDDPYEPLVITRFFARLCKRMGVDYDLYDLRHTYATNLARQGVHPAKIQYLMGHSRPTMALDAYIHIDTSHLDDIADTVTSSITEKKPEQNNEAEKLRVVNEVVK